MNKLATKDYVDESIIGRIKAGGRYDVRLGVVVDGELYQAVGDGVTDDAPALQQIMQYITDRGGGEMWFPIGTYMCRSSVWIRDSVLVNGTSWSVLTSDVDPADQLADGVPANERMYGIFRSDQVTPIPNGWACENIIFKGNVTEHPTVPQANRTRDPSPFHAIKINGSKAPNTSDDFGQPTSGPLISNIFIRNITVKDMASLPITIWGVSDRNITTQCFFDNNKDIGYVYNDEVIFTGNHSSNSSDNGVSLSRGNKKIVCVGNTIENAALFGIWLSGYNTDIGPTQFVCVGNTVKSTGRSGINLDYGPSDGIIANNYIEQGYHRGPWDAPSDTGIDGITIAGAGGGIHASGLLIANNRIKSAARNGIAFKELDDSMIIGNVIIDPGTAFKANGTTPILAGDTTSNNGICPIATGSYSNVRIKDNLLLETRITPVGNWPVSSAATGGTYVRNNDFNSNWRNANNTLTVSDAVMAGQHITFQYDGDDTNVDIWENFKGSGKKFLRSADGSNFVINSTSTSSAAKATALFSAGSDPTSYIGGITASRQDASSSSIVAFRGLRNGILASDGTSAPFYLKGLPTNSGFALGLNGGQIWRRTAVADASYIALEMDYIIAYTSLTANRTVTLKDATTISSNQAYLIQDETGSASSHTITISPAAGTINGASTAVINLNYGRAIVYNDGTNWFAAGLYNSSQLTSAPDATTSSKGLVQLAGSLAGTAASPTVVNVTDSNGVQAIGVTATSSAVNYLNVTNAATGGAVTIAPAGTDTNIPFNIQGKGTGTVNIRSATNSTAAIKIQNATGANTIMDFDTSNLRAGIRTVTPTSSFHVAGSFSTALASKSSAYTLTETDSTILASGTTTITLPTAAGITGRLYTIKKTDAAGTNVTVGTTSSQTIDGSTTYVLSAQYQAVIVQSDGSNWQVVGKV